MKQEKDSEQAEIKITRVVRRVTHSCRSDDSRPCFDGEVVDESFIQWPVAFDRYRMGYCPWCGKRLPLKLKEEK